MTVEMTHTMMIDTEVIIAAFVLFLNYSYWKRPLDFFKTAGVEIPSGSSGERWLRRFHAAIAICAAAFVIGPAAVILDKRLFSSAMGLQIAGVALSVVLFPLWARMALKAAPRTETPSIALEFESRPLRESLSWSAEAATAAFFALLWVITLWRTPEIWRAGLLLTWLAEGMFPAKIVMWRAVIPLPPERAAEYRRWYEASRAGMLRMANRWQWLMGGAFAMIVAGRSWPALLAQSWARPALLLAFLAFIFGQFLYMLAPARQVAELGRDLQNSAHFTGPFGPVKPAVPGGKTWFFTYLGGAALLILWAGIAD